MSYGPNLPDAFGRVADLVDKIPRRAKLADIPVEQPTRVDLAVNLATAGARPHRAGLADRHGRQSDRMTMHAIDKPHCRHWEWREK